MSRELCIALIGPTASGKSAIAMQLAEKLEGEILCLDSTTVYKHFNIGTSKPTAEDQQKIPHHMLDLLEPSEPFSAGHFTQLAESAISHVSARGKLPIVVGGTYFYLRALQHGMYPTPPIPAEVIDAIERNYFEDDKINTEKMHQDLQKKDPASAKSIHPNDKYRLLRALAILATTGEKPSALQPVPFSAAQQNRLWLKYAVLVSRNDLTQNISNRVDKMLEMGLVDEVRKLKETYPQARALQSIGYAETVRFLERQLTEKQLRIEIIEKTRQLAKRQMTWLRSDPEVRYIDFRDMERVQLEVNNLRSVLTARSQAS